MPFDKDVMSPALERIVGVTNDCHPMGRHVKIDSTPLLMGPLTSAVRNGVLNASAWIAQYRFREPAPNDLWSGGQRRLDNLAL